MNADAASPPVTGTPYNPAIHIEWCRECRDEQWGRGEPHQPVAAEFVLWGKFFPSEVVGPKCYDHAAKHIGWSNMSAKQLGQWAVLDLRPLVRL